MRKSKIKKEKKREKWRENEREEQPGIHIQGGKVESRLHQCFKYYKIAVIFPMKEFWQISQNKHRLLNFGM